MELQEKIDRQIARSVREVLIRFSRDEVPDAGNLAVALASGETSQSLAEKVKAKVEQRNQPPTDKANAALPSTTVADVHAPSVEDVLTPSVEVVADEGKDPKEDSGRQYRRAHHAPTHHKK